MPASIYPPAELSIYDPGNVPEIWVDGCAYYTEDNGVVRTGFYALEPIMPIAGDLTTNPETIAKLCFRFRCTVATQRLMKAQVMRAQNALDKVLMLAS